MVVCLTGSRFNMYAEVLRWDGITAPTDIDVDSGTWETYQDPITGEIRNQWVPGTPQSGSNPPTSIRTINCLARGIVDGGIRVAGSTERFGDEYINVEFVKLWIPSGIKITKRDRITNIKSTVDGPPLWVDEDGQPTVFNVNGITPLFDAFNMHRESYILLERADA